MSNSIRNEIDMTAVSRKILNAHTKKTQCLDRGSPRLNVERPPTSRLHLVRRHPQRPPVGRVAVAGSRPRRGHSLKDLGRHVRLRPGHVIQGSPCIKRKAGVT